jgi:hypothetical protein
LDFAAQARAQAANDSAARADDLAPTMPASRETGATPTTTYRVFRLRVDFASLVSLVVAADVSRL